MYEFEYRGYEHREDIAQKDLVKWRRQAKYGAVELIHRDQWYLIGWLKPHEARELAEPTSDPKGKEI